jgi:hypothetical protein
LPNGLRYLRVGRRGLAWEQEKPEARKMLLNRADSHLSGVSMKGQSNGLQSGTFLDMLLMFGERERISGNAALGSSRKACEKFQEDRNKLDQVFPEGHRDDVTVPFGSA